MFDFLLHAWCNLLHVINININNYIFEYVLSRNVSRNNSFIVAGPLTVAILLNLYNGHYLQVLSTCLPRPLPVIFKSFSCKGVSLEPVASKIRSLKKCVHQAIHTQSLSREWCVYLSFLRSQKSWSRNPSKYMS